MKAGAGVRFVLGALATWRLAHLVANEDGPADVVVRLRRTLGDSPLGQLADCFQCLSVWVAAPIALYVATDPTDRLVAWLALSGAACLLERLGPEGDAAVVIDEEGRGAFDGVLWTEPGGRKDDRTGRRG